MAEVGRNGAAGPRWTVITGASSGIGAALAEAFAAQGRSLVLTARRHDRLHKLALELQTRHDIRIETIPCDLEERSAPAVLIGAIEARGIVIDTLVNNAGFGLRGPFGALDLPEQMAMIRLNILALTELSRRVLPGLLERGQGGIVNVASTAAFQAGPNMAVYFATKAFVLSLSEALYEEAKHRGVTVTALCPGPTWTEFQDRAGLRNSRIFARGAMSAEEVAAAGVAGYEARQAIVIPGRANRFGALGAQLAPRGWVRRIAARLQG